MLMTVTLDDHAWVIVAPDKLLELYKNSSGLRVGPAIRFEQLRIASQRDELLSNYVDALEVHRY